MKSRSWQDEALLRGYKSSATALLNTILRSLVQEREAPIWTATLVRTLEVCGVQERNARQAIARVAEKGDLRAEKVGAKTRWHITDKGHALFASAQQRAVEFRAVQDDWDEHWWVLVFNMARLPRETRRMIRARIRFRGCGFINAGTVVSTHVDREAMILNVLSEFNLDGSAVVFQARTRNLPNDDDLLKQVWDLDELADEYAEFIAEVEQRTVTGSEDTFAAYVELEHKWVQFVVLDPELPRVLLPDPWLGERAKALFDSRIGEWRGIAQTWLERVEALAG